MAKTRNVLGLLAALLILLSAGAHSFLGWPSIRAQLEAAHVPVDLILGLKVGWLFGGACMVVFAAIVTAIFLTRLRGEQVSAFPALAIGIAYLAFGTWALVTTKDPFFTIFLVPGALLVIAAARVSS
jgi:hypothetical protein